MSEEKLALSRAETKLVNRLAYRLGSIAGDLYAIELTRAIKASPAEEDITDDWLIRHIPTLSEERLAAAIRAQLGLSDQDEKPF